jgi:aryl-alcohol dehydrogenase-like predicted oxidoreductase
VLEEPRRLSETGLAIGLTVTGAHEAETIECALEIPIFDTVQATWNLLERSAGPMLAEAHAAVLRLIVKEPLANGRLTFAPTFLSFWSSPNAAGSVLDALAIAAVLAQSWADVVLSGPVTAVALCRNPAALSGSSLANGSTRSSRPWSKSPHGTGRSARAIFRQSLY